MSKICNQTDNKHLIYEAQKDLDDEQPLMHPRDVNPLFWNERIALISKIEDDQFWNFTAFDVFTNESRLIQFRKSSNQFEYFEIYPLNGKIGLFVERYCGNCRVNLVQINWLSGEFEILNHSEHKCQFLTILVNKLDSTKFVMTRYRGFGIPISYQICRIVDSGIQFADEYQTFTKFDYYSDGKLIIYKQSDGTIKIKIYDWDLKNKQIFEIDRMPEDVVYTACYYAECIGERMYIPIQFHDTYNYGLAWISLNEKRWVIMEFETKLEIRTLEFFNDNLVVCAMKRNNNNTNAKSEVMVYSVPIRVQFLRKLAWLATVRKMKHGKKENLYTAAIEFLPRNSDLRPPWFEDKEEGDESTDNTTDESTDTTKKINWRKVIKAQLKKLHWRVKSLVKYRK